ncbi:MAG: hypothetical protein R2932_59670 [Caldilineaceae bacterium]
MSKGQSSKKNDKKKPAKTKDEKRQAKRDKKGKKNPSDVVAALSPNRGSHPKA